jgi:hypothetical protein
MDTLARSALEKLLSYGEAKEAGVRTLAAALTTSRLAEYRKLRSLQSKLSFETTMRDARAQGAISLSWDDAFSEDGFISRADLCDLRKLAEFLGKVPVQDYLLAAQDRLAPLLASFPVLDDVIGRWSKLRKVRGLGPEDLQEWLDAARVIDYARANLDRETNDLPIREASARLFNDSKRIEKLLAPVDVLLSGDLEAEARQSSDVWQELGLFREEHPVRMAGNVMVRRERVTAYLDTPYSGLPAPSVIGLASTPQLLMTIENQTTFHSEAWRRCEENVLLIYTAGMPTPAWRAMYIRLLKDLPVDVPVYHWGDIDEGGFRIAASLANDAKDAGYVLKPWLMHPDDVPLERRTVAKPGTLLRIKHFAAAAGWAELGELLAQAGFTVEQEGLA